MEQEREVDVIDKMCKLPEAMKEGVQVQTKAICMLMAHMGGYLDKHYNLDDPKVQKDLETILRNIPSYIDIMIMITMYLVMERKHGRTEKNITCKNIIALIQFS
jgi:hypothetical protein